MEMNNDESDLSIYDFNSIINYIKNNYIQLLLLILVFCIIYAVDYISNINTMLMAPISMIPSQKILTPHIPHIPHIKMPKGGKKSKK
jgi:hypothetical protein